MPPKDKKKKKKPKAPAYLTGAADLAPFGVQPNALVRSSLGLVGTVLGVKADASGQPRLWIRYASGLEAPVEASGTAAPAERSPGDSATGVAVASAAAHVQRAVAELQAEKAELEAKWKAHERDQEVLQAAATKKKGGKKKQPAAAAPLEEQQQPVAQQQQQQPELQPEEDVLQVPLAAKDMALGSTALFESAEQDLLAPPAATGADVAMD